MTQSSFAFEPEPPAEPEPEPELDPTLTVTELSDRIGRALRVAFPAKVWVRGEIQGLSRASAAGHRYFSLVDGASGRHHADAVVRVALFNRTREVVERQLRRSGDLALADGLEVRIEGTVDYHGASGQLSLRMTAIDPAHTLGRLALDRQRLLTRLATDGLLERNRALPLPLVPLRVGLVASMGTAGAVDFLTQLRESGLGWQVVVSDARVQGPSASRRVARGVRVLGQADVDVIVVVRGGGARSDLTIFDAEPIARAIADSPVPVLTGIGHEVDRAVADEVAHTACKTPTACAALLIDRVRTYQATVEERWASLTAVASRALVRADAELDTHARGLARDTRAALGLADQRVAHAARTVARDTTSQLASAERRLARARARATAAGAARLRDQHRRLGDATRRLGRAAPRPTHDAERTLDTLAARVQAVDPDRLLARGWSITTTTSGQLVRSLTDLAPGDRVRTHLRDGTVESEVQHLEPQHRASGDQP